MNNLVSIIMPCFNSESFISSSVRSVLSQSYTNWELIIIDDASTDNTRAILNDFLNRDNRIKVFANPENIGVAKSRNIGLENAKGDFIAFLDSDDIWHTQKLEIQTNYMIKNSYKISFTSYNRIDKSEKSLKLVRSPIDNVDFKILLLGNVIAMSTSMINSKIIDKVRFKSIGHEDYLFWLQLLRFGHKAHNINEVLVDYRVHNTSISSNKLKAISYSWNIYINELNFNFFSSMYYFVIHILNAILKRI